MINAPTIKCGKEYTDAELDELDCTLEAARRILGERRGIPIGLKFITGVAAKRKLKFSRPFRAAKIFHFRDLEAAYLQTFQKPTAHLGIKED